MKTFLKISALFIVLGLIVSCNSGTEKKSASTSSNSLEEVLKAADAISPEITNVADVFKTLDLVEAAYYPILCNDPYSAQSYLENKTVAAANLGVYVTDIVYHMYGDATSEMFVAFSASQELARYIGLESEFAATLLTELEGGDISRDSLIHVFNGLMEKSEKYSSENEMAYVHTSFLTGLYIEKLFITSSLLDQSSKKEEKTEKDVENAKKLLAVFQKQLTSLDALSESLDGKFSKVKDLINEKEIAALKEYSTALDAEIESLLKAATFESGEQVNNLYKQITAIRTRIVSAS